MLLGDDDIKALRYLARVRRRFGQWILDTAAADYDQAWLDYQPRSRSAITGQSERELGELAASLLLHAIETGRVGPPAEVRLPLDLIVRRSCGCTPSVQAR